MPTCTPWVDDRTKRRTKTCGDTIPIPQPPPCRERSVVCSAPRERLDRVLSSENNAPDGLCGR